MHEVNKKIVEKKIKNLKQDADTDLLKYNSSISAAYSLFSYGSNFDKVFKEANLKLQKIKWIKGYGR